MRQFRYEYDYEEVFELCSGVTLRKVYTTPAPPKEGNDENFRLSELYALTVDEKDFFAVNCLKQACDNVFLSLKRHSFGSEPYGFYVDKEIEDPTDPTKTVKIKTIYYDVAVGAVQDTMIKQYILKYGKIKTVYKLQ